MRVLFFFICFGLAVTGFAQRERHGNSRPWEVFAGYQHPIGKWSDIVDFYPASASDGPVYSDSFSDRTGQHARMGFNAGLIYTWTSVGRSGFAKNFQVMFYIADLSVMTYDLESDGPAIASSKIKPWLQYQAAVAPCYGLNVGGGSMKLYGKLGIAVKHTGGEVHYERQASAMAELDQVKYSYTGVGVCLGPGVKFITGRIGIGAELQLGYNTGKYKGEGSYTNSSGDITSQWTQNIPNSIFRSPSLNAYVSYAFGG
jgi:hypothetical protein